jgi:pimeloyl-ACP methyl ester carboxylesterase
MQASAYLGDLGGLFARCSPVLVDLRGTGASAVPADPASYRCDRLVDDVEALRVHLGLDRIDLLGHSAGAALALLYAARHLDRVGRLALINPSPRVVGLEITDLDRRQVAERRRGRPGSRTPSPHSSGSGRATPRPPTGRRSHPSPTADGTPSARPTSPGRRARQTRRRRPSTTRPVPSTRKPPEPPWPAFGHRSLSSRASTTSHSPPGVPLSMPACSVRPSWSCSRAADTFPGSTIRSGSCRPWPRSCADRSAQGEQVPSHAAMASADRARRPPAPLLALGLRARGARDAGRCAGRARSPPLPTRR